MLLTVNSSKRNHYHVIFFFPKYISLIKSILSLTIVTSGSSLYLFSHCQSKQRQTQSCVIEISFSRHLSLATVFLSIFSYLLSSIPLSVLVPYQLSNQKLYITPKKGISTLDVSLLGNAIPLCRQVTSGHCSIRLLPNIYLTVHKRVIRPKHSCEYRAPD